MEKVQNLSELLRILRAEAGKNIEECLEFLQKLIGKYINIRYEVAHGDVRRILLTSKRQSADFSNELVRQCNGVVLEFPSWKICAIPPKMFSPKFRHDRILANLSDYQIYKIKDGTTVTLYWYDEKWCLSSANGFEVNNYKWMGESTYFSAFCDVAAQYPEFSLDNLDKTKSYTIGFRHESFQPLLADKRDIWFIQSCDIVRGNETYEIIYLSNTENIGIPAQDTITYCGENIIHTIYDENSSALTKFINPAAAIHYGFILRSVSGTNPDIIFESELLKTIRRLFYDLPKHKFTDATRITGVVTPQNRLEYIILRAYLSHKSRYLFIDLFPQYAQFYKKYDIKFNMLSNKVIRLLRDKNIGASKLNASTKKMDILALELAKYIESQEHVNVMNEHGPGIVLDFLTDVRNLELYFPCFTCE